jgi:cytochrome P450
MTRVSSHAEVHEVLRSPHFAAALHSRASYPLLGESLPTLTGGDHTLRRRSEIVMFSRQALEGYEFGLVVPAVRESLDAAAGGGAPIDLMSVTQNALLRVSAQVVGLDGVDSVAAVQVLRDMAVCFGEGASAEWATAQVEEIMSAAMSAKAGFVEKFWLASRRRRGDLVARWRDGTLAEEELPNDLLTILLKTYDDWDEDKLVRECIFFIVASSSTTTHSAPHTMNELDGWFARHPDKFELRHDVGFLQRAVSEALRLHPPVPALLRTALIDIALSTGRQFAAGEQIALDLNAANQDVSFYGADSAEFDPFREIPGKAQLFGASFGAGPHVCPGRLVAVGAGNGTNARDEQTVGVLTRLLQELYRHGVALDRGDPPVLRTDTTAERFSRFPVTVGATPT